MNRGIQQSYSIQQWAGWQWNWKKGRQRERQRRRSGICWRAVAEFYMLRSSCETEKLRHPRVSWKWLHPPSFFFFFLDFFPLQNCCNDHLSILSVGTKSRCAVARYRGLKGGNSYLTCTAERQRLTERCHFQRKRSAPNCKRNVARQGQGVTKTCVWDDPGPQVGAPV